MRAIFTLVFLSLFYAALAQGTRMIDKEITVGSTIKVVKCRAGAVGVESMDLYVKTRFPDNGLRKDSLTGDGVFEWFFSTGDFDAKRLPCSYSDQTYTVATLREVPDNEREGEIRRIVLCYGRHPLEMIWIELDKAVALNEIIF
jgi:hypothetical protein